jgi:hypothetical protein
MTQAIGKLFGTPSQATAAADRLRATGYRHVFVFLGDPSGADEAEAAIDPGVVKAMMDAHVYKPHAQIYAAHIANGASLVLVYAYWGTAQKAITLLKSFGPLPDAIPKPPTPSRFIYNERTPFSSTFELPLLTEKVMHPAETISGIPSLTRRPRLVTSRLFPILSGSASPLSGLLKLPVLTRSKTPLSSLFRLPLLKRR